METFVIRKTMRVPVPAAPPGDGTAMARRLDAALLSVGFTLSPELLAELSGRDPSAVTTLAVKVLAAVRELVGDHVAHNVYFADFPANVPDTMEFWLGLARKAATTPGGEAVVRDLLSLPGYGRYRHTFEDMAAVHEDFLELASDRVTVLNLGGTPEEEAAALYLALAASTVPLNAADLAGLAALAKTFVDGPEPETVPVRENKAVVNAARLARGLPIRADTVTDVLRAACGLSGGDVTLLEPTRFGSFTRAQRTSLLSTLDAIAADAEKLADVGRHTERWKRLGERLHPHEYPRWPGAAAVFAVARGDRSAPTLAARVERALSTGDGGAAIGLLRAAPGVLLRSVDRLARAGAPGLFEAVRDVAPGTSTRMLLALRQHLGDRDAPSGPRLFVNRSSLAWARSDGLPPLDAGLVAELRTLLDTEITDRLPDPGAVVYDPAVLDVALPLSQKGDAAGFGVLPRGSRTPVRGELLRFFTHWRQNRHTTDYDLSALLLDDRLATAGWLSFTELKGFGGTHSGDITAAPDGASEFIDLALSEVEARYIVAQVDIYDGEGFANAAESYFGYMERDATQLGMPFEARTVRMKSDVRGAGRVALPLLFARDDAGGWSAVWLHLFLQGRPDFNMVEDNAASTTLMVRGVLGRAPLTMRYLFDLWRSLGVEVAAWDPLAVPAGKVTWIGFEPPEGLPPGADVHRPERFAELVPE
ncbi:TerD family protein [Phytomonospora endophytica]|uniref:TerD family protein n=1 Tax=Phytomonospora endophytica TaxID=714109 RepID=A0A841FZ76_9ACTN|nr:TerD family protein [Phytomonospora endophytica]MBB6039018.1 hypothetical protein [Phytomonospora endophytica]GIG69496.1 hypothetical protein Pen01_57910 [Phytomonospora endophytica]